MEERPASLACLKGGNPGEFIACADYLTRLSPARLTCLRCAWLVTATRPCLDSATISVKEFASQRASFVARGKRSLRVGLETQRTALLSVETVVLGKRLDTPARKIQAQRRSRRGANDMFLGQTQ